MPISFSCSDCGRQYKVKDELAGKRTKCKDCGSPIQVPHGDEEEDEVYDAEYSDHEAEEQDYGYEEEDDDSGDDDYDEYQQPSRRQPRRQPGGEGRRRSGGGRGRSRRGGGDLSNVATGFQLIYFGLCGIILGILTAAALGAGRMEAATLIGTGIVVLGSVTMLVGKVFCLGAPTAQGLIYASVGLDVFGVIVSIGVQANMISPRLTAGSSLLSIVGSILFLLFCKALAEHIRRGEIADQAVGVMIAMGAMLGCLVLMVILPFLGGLGVGLALFLGIILLVVAIVTLVKYVRLITAMKDALN